MTVPAPTDAAVLIEGKAKIVCEDTTPGHIRVTFKDSATAFNGEKFAIFPGKGTLNATFTHMLLGLLEKQGIATCLVEKGASPNQLIYRKLTMIPLEVVVRNHVYGSMRKRFMLEEGQKLVAPVVEYFWKKDAANDPQITEAMVEELACLPKGACLKEIKRRALQANEMFVKFFGDRGIRCADFKLEFGLTEDGQLLLGDELSPDNFRLRDEKTGEVLDKDVFRLDLADLVETYEKLLKRVEAGPAFAWQGTNTYAGEVIVDSRKSILNPESRAILNSLHGLGYEGIDTVRAGKRFEVTLTAENMVVAEAQLAKIAADVLSNPVIEDVSYDLWPVTHPKGA